MFQNCECRGQSLSPCRTQRRVNRTSNSQSHNTIHFSAMHCGVFISFSLLMPFSPCFHHNVISYKHLKRVHRCFGKKILFFVLILRILISYIFTGNECSLCTDSHCRTGLSHVRGYSKLLADKHNNFSFLNTAIIQHTEAVPYKYQKDVEMIFQYKFIHHLFLSSFIQDFFFHKL